jgi:beta-ketoacyl-acyl-carrier-protein synthase II
MAQHQDERRRVAITGMGAWTPLGRLDEFWTGLLAGRSGIRRITQYDPDGQGVQVAGEVVGFEPKAYIPPKEARRMSRASQMALTAARAALADAGLTPEEVAEIGDRAAVEIGSVNAGFAMLLEASYDFTFRGKQPAPIALLNGLTNMPGHYISVEMKAAGPLETISTACASGTQALGAGIELIRSGRADLVFAGGVDCLIRKEILAAFDAMTVLANKYNGRPAEASRPFDAERNGFVMGEGAGVMVLESLERAQQRGARIYAEAAGHAASSDARHAAAPDAEGLGAIKAMRWALQDSGLRPEQIDYINAHGTGTRINDATETRAIKTLFGEHAYRLAISSTKSMIGHCMGAAGMLEAMATALSIYHGRMHPTINLCTPDPGCDLDYVPNVARPANIRAALSNSFGLGGQNACVVLTSI